jgi:acetoin utilization deacetylase AcuC-like enzyme
MKATGLLLDPVFLLHDTGPGHPESMHRYTALLHKLAPGGNVEHYDALAMRTASKAEITTCHTDAYYELAKSEIADGARQLSTGDTQVCEASFDVVCQAVGGALNAVDAVFEPRVTNAFCAIRPPGHHATPDQGMGFCIFNSAAIAARYAQQQHGIERVVIVDWDVHHGNGTQDIFYEDGSVFYFSTHQSPLYPGTGARIETGAGEGLGTTLNCPVPAGSGMVEIGAAFRDEFLPAMDAFQPELVIISAGFDSRIDDPLGGLQLKDEDFATLTRLLMDLADQYADGRIVSVLEGGYNVDGLASSVSAHLAALQCGPLKKGQ